MPAVLAAPAGVPSCYLVLAAEPAVNGANGYLYVDNLRPGRHCN